MPTPSTGRISLASVSMELGNSGTTAVSLNDAGVRSLAGVASGAISLSNLHAKASDAAYLFTGGVSSPTIEVYSWSTSGWGSKFAAPTGTATGYSSAIITNYGVVRKGNYVFYAGSGAPRIWARVFTSSGWGTLSAAPQITLDTVSYGIAVDPLGTVVGTANASTSPYLQIYPWSPGNGWNGGGFGTWYSAPATPPTGTGQSIAWSRSGLSVAIGHTNAPRSSVYPFSPESGFGTKFSDPATAQSGTGYGVGFTNGSFIHAGRISSSTTPAYPDAYAWSDSAGFGTRYSNPSNGYTKTFPQGLAVSQDGTKITVASFYNNSTTYSLPNMHMWTFSDASGWGTYFTNPAGAPTADNSERTAINAQSNVAAFASDQAPTVRVWAISGSGFGSKFADPSSATGTSRRSLAFG